MHRIESFSERTSAIVDLARGRHVLHLGAIGETMGTKEQKISHIRSSLHQQLTDAAASCIGIDHDAHTVKDVLTLGVIDNLIAGDVLAIERSQIPMDSIDLVVAADVLEHVENPGMLLRRAASWITAAGKIVITVPNSVGLPQFVRYARGRAIEGQDHVCSFNVYTLKLLLERTGWAVESIGGCYQPAASKLHSGARFRIGRRLLQMRPDLAGTLLIVATPTK